MPVTPTRVPPPLKWHGGKHYLAARIVALMPPRCRTPNRPDPADPGGLHYVEPFFGGGSVLLANDPTGISEVVNDIHGELTNFWRVLQGPDTFASFHRILEATPFSEAEWSEAVAGVGGDPVEQAARFFV